MLFWQVNPSAPICKPCRDDITKCVADPSYCPRWGKNATITDKCCVLDCDENTKHTCSSINRDELELLFHKVGVKCKSIITPVPTPQCKYHYHLFYNLHQPTQTNCVTCTAALKHSKARVCPQPKVVQEYLNHSTGFKGQIHPNSKEGNACYQSHLSLLQNVSTTLPVSTNEDLQHLIDTYTKKVRETTDLHSLDDVTEDATIGAQQDAYV